MQDDHRLLKEWLSGLLPEGLSRQDVADELGVTRKTVSSMISPTSGSFGKGLTMLLYLRLAGALRDAPEEAPGSSRLAAVEARLDEIGAKLDDLATLVRDQRWPPASQERGNGA